MQNGFYAKQLRKALVVCVNSSAQRIMKNDNFIILFPGISKIYFNNSKAASRSITSEWLWRKTVLTFSTAQLHAHLHHAKMLPVSVSFREVSNKLDSVLKHCSVLKHEKYHSAEMLSAHRCSCNTGSFSSHFWRKQILILCYCSRTIMFCLRKES